MMKRLIALLLALLLLPLAGLAEETEAGDIVVTLPDGASFIFTPLEDSYWVTRESAPARFLNLGMDYREALPFMEAYGVYALMYDEGETSEIQVTAYEHDRMDLRELTAADEQEICEYWAEGYREQGYEVTDCEILRLEDGRVYIRTLMSLAYEDGWTDYVLEYVAMQDGWEIGVYLFSYLVEGITPEQSAMAQSVADSLWITPAQ